MKCKELLEQVIVRAAAKFLRTGSWQHACRSFWKHTASLGLPAPLLPNLWLMHARLR